MRVRRRTSKLSVSAARMCSVMKASRKVVKLRRGAQDRDSAAIIGAPRIMPTAKAEVSDPATATETCKSPAMSGTRPASMNSEVPMAKTARASR
jgi:hypothetical protein